MVESQTQTGKNFINSSNQINISFKKPANFYVFLGQKYLIEHETIEIHAQGNAAAIGVIAAESLVRNEFAIFQSIRTKTIPVQGQMGERKKAKLFIQLKRHPNFEKSMKKINKNIQIAIKNKDKDQKVNQKQEIKKIEAEEIKQSSQILKQETEEIKQATQQVLEQEKEGIKQTPQILQQKTEVIKQIPQIFEQEIESQSKILQQFVSTESSFNTLTSKLQENEKIEINNLNIEKIKNSHRHDIEPQQKLTIINGLQQLLSSCNINLELSNAQSQKSSLQSMPLLSSFITNPNNYVANLKLHDDGKTGYSIQQIQKSSVSRAQFEQEIRQIIGDAFNAKIEDVLIISVSEGSIDIQFLIKGINQIMNTDFQQRIDKARINLQKNIANKIVDLSKTSLVYILNTDDFDKRGNIQFTEGGTFPRGGLDYLQPAAPWERICLNVEKKYAKDGWLEMDGNPNEWAVAFHGVRESTGVALDKIILEGLKIGPAQAYQSDTCANSNQKVGEGVYCTPDINVAEGYTQAVQLNNKKYKYIFQCRVRPSAIKQSESMKALKYWVINDPIDIRPYGICFKEVA